MPRMASAMSAAPVGQPHWSATTCEPVALAAKAQHRLDEVRAVRAENPGGAQDHVAVEPLADRPLAGCLAGPVDAERPERIVFGVGRRLGAVEHVIGGKVDERDPGLGRGFGQMGRPIGVDGECRIRLRFGAINGGIGGGVDDQRRPVALHDVPDRIPIGDIEIVVAKPDRR